MLLSNQRHILHFDLAMDPFPADAPIIPLEQIIPHLEKRVKAKSAVQVIDDGRRIVRLAEMEPCTVLGDKPGMAFLFSLGDRSKADPGFTDFETGAVRVAKPRAGEAGGLSVHAVASLEPTKPKGQLYRFLYEDVTGFGRAFIQDFLRSQFKIISDEQGLSFEREGKREIKTRPMVRLTGHASDQLKNSLEGGRLLNIELVEYIEDDLGLDESKFFKSVRRNLNVSVSKNLPHGEELEFVERVKAWAKGQGYETMRVRWKEPENKRPLSAQVDTARQDAGEVFFIRSVEVSLSHPLADISETLSKELIKKMCAIMD